MVANVILIILTCVLEVASILKALFPLDINDDATFPHHSGFSHGSVHLEHLETTNVQQLHREPPVWTES